MSSVKFAFFGVGYYTAYVAGRKKAVLVDMRKAGQLGGEARARNLSREARSESARRAVEARWDAYYAAHPEKRRKKKRA